MRLLSPRELADALGVSESSLKRWVDAGKITAARTDGGHRKISLPEAVRFIRETGAPVARPELLDMPEVAAVQARSVVPRGDDGFRHYLLEGDAVGARGWLLSHYLAGRTIAELCDGPVRAAMHRIGELWAHDAEGIFIEHRATDACIQALAHLRSTLEPVPRAPVAIGGAPEDDPYMLPSFMAASACSSENSDCDFALLRSRMESFFPIFVSPLPSSPWHLAHFSPQFATAVAPRAVRAALARANAAIECFSFMLRRSGSGWMNRGD